ncbi:MAG TPA: hypothetical protein VMP11_17605 [Verrucomicrobiae bacterium]|nr:hypothetical protein [Verrucomicrobiae bacterium]
MRMRGSRVVEYKIVIASNPETLVAEVNKLIDQQWQPFGGLVVTREALSGLMQSFMQPMVREPRRRAGNLKAQASAPPNLV